MMKTLDNWLLDYSESHQNPTNQLLHRICVPAIFFSILGMFWSIPVGHTNFAVIAIILAMFFYVRLGMKAVALILPQIIISVLILYYWGQHSVTWPLCLVIFIVAWIGQFVGHELEGKKPSFFKDLQFLLIGPLWVFLPHKPHR
jgi:uncharacterized membrane protein YGL010W